MPVAQIVPPPALTRTSWFASMAGTFTMHDDLIEPAGYRTLAAT